MIKLARYFAVPRDELIKKSEIARAISGLESQGAGVQANMAANQQALKNQSFIEGWVGNYSPKAPEVPRGPELPDILGATLAGVLGGALGVRGDVAGQSLDVLRSRQMAGYQDKLSTYKSELDARDDFLRRSGGVRDDLVRALNTGQDDLRMIQNSVVDRKTDLYEIDKRSRDRKEAQKAGNAFKMDLAEATSLVGLARQMSEVQKIPIEQAIKVVFAKQFKDKQMAENDTRETNARIGRIAAETQLEWSKAAKIDEETRLLPKEMERRWVETRARIAKNNAPKTSLDLKSLRKDYVGLLSDLEKTVAQRQKEFDQIESALGRLLEAKDKGEAVDERVLRELSDRHRFAESRLNKTKKALDDMKVERDDALRNAGKGAVKGATAQAGFKPGAVCTDSTDCSLFAQRTLAAMGVKFPSTTATQIKQGTSIVKLKSDIKPGDLIFFATQGGNRVSHVGVYVGEGRFRHASSTGKRGPSRNKGLQYMYKEESLEDYLKRYPAIDVRRYSA